MEKVTLHPKLELYYTTVKDGNIDARFAPEDVVKKNRKAIFKQLGIQPFQVIEAAQVHQDRVLQLNEENTKMWRGHNITGVDGFITDQTDAYIMLKVADCVPLIMYDPEHHVMGVIHAGWRGTIKGIHLKALNNLTKAYGTNPRDLLAWFGPCAHGCCFTADQEPEQYRDKSWRPYIKKRKNVYKVDFLNYQVDTLKAAGMLKKNMHVDSQCTVETETLYSHQGTKTNGSEPGRFAVISRLK